VLGMEERQSLHSPTVKKKQHLEPLYSLKTQQLSTEENEVYIKHSEMYNYLWDVIGLDFPLFS